MLTDGAQYPFGERFYSPDSVRPEDELRVDHGRTGVSELSSAAAALGEIPTFRVLEILQ